MRRLVLASLALTSAGAAAHSQGIGDPLLSAAITQSVTADTNFGLDDPSPGTSYYADTRLVLGLLNETPTQAFTLNLDTGLRALREAEEDFEFTFASPTTGRVDFDQEWSSGSIETYLRYRQREINSTSIDFIDEDPTDGAVDDIREEVTTTDAIERRYDGGFDLAIATDSPSSYELNFVGTRFDYSDDADDETPRTTLVGDGAWLLRFNPVLRGTLGVGYSYYTADNERETEIRQSEIDAGFVYDASEALQLRAGVGYANYIREQLDDAGRRQTLRDDGGFVLRGGLNYDFEEVTIVANARLSDAAPETRLSGDVRATYPLPRGRLTGQIFQRYGGGDTGDEIRVTGATVGILHEINTVSGLEFAFSAARQEDLETDDPDTDRLNFTATYTYALTEAVSANIGYRFRALDEDPDSATSNAVFVEIGRVFETRP